jgi:hypothetical protein
MSNDWNSCNCFPVSPQSGGDNATDNHTADGVATWFGNAEPNEHMSIAITLGTDAAVTLMPFACSSTFLADEIGAAFQTLGMCHS